MANVIEFLKKRGFLEAVTGEEVQQHANRPLSVYCGFDPTSDSLHLGNLVSIMGLAWFQRFGHTPVAIVGGATGMIGDPSGKSAERQLLDEETIQTNLVGIRKNLEAVLDFNAPNKPLILNNYDWFKEFSYIHFLRDVGKFFRLGPMLAKEMVRNRMNSEEGISYTEFSYQILQGYDFLHLYEKHGVTLQLGGSDQWGNILSGTELIRKKKGADAFGLTFPLLVRSDGKKFGKSEQGAIWLSPEKLSPYEFYQYLYRMPDADVPKLMRMLTFMDTEEIEAIEAAMGQASYAANSAQKRLAEEVTRIVHGEAGLEKAQRATAVAAPGKQTTLDAEMLESAAADMPSVDAERDQIIGKPVVDLLVTFSLASSKGEARRLIDNGGVSINNSKVEDKNLVLSPEMLVESRLLLFSIGKKKKTLVRLKT